MFAVLHIADFALHAVLRTEADAVRAGFGTAELPAALFSGSGKKSLAIAINSAARSFGVELGMTAPQAVARCPTLIIRAPNAEAEAEARAALLAVGFTLSPSIEDTAPGICTTDVHGLDPTQRGKRAATAIAELARLGLPATAGIARTPLLALYAARASTPSEVGRVILNPPPQDLRPPSQHPSKITSSTLAEPPASYLTSASPISELGSPLAATDYPAPPPSLSALNSHLSALNFSFSPVRTITDEKTFLAPLPLAAADPSPQLTAVLSTWGLRTLGDLTALPRDEIVRRFGAEGLALWTRAAGGDNRPLHPVQLPQEFAARMEFENEIETLEPLLFILRRFLERLTLELRAAQLVAAELDLTLSLEDDTRHALHLRLPEPNADVDILFRALHTHLESLRTAASIRALHLRLTPARPLIRQQDLFETGLRDPHGFAETLARVAALVGSDRLGTPQLEDTHRPDAVKLVPPASVIPPAADPPLHPPFGLPLRRFRPPLPARLEFTAGHPTYLWTEHVHGEILAQSHAFPSNGDWWQQDRAWSRLEWDITLADGGLYRLIQSGEAYFLEGEYD